MNPDQIVPRNKKLQVLIFIKSLSGGAGKSATQYARILSENDFSVSLVVGRADDKLSATLPATVSFEILGMRGRIPPIVSLSSAIRRIRPQITLVIGMGNGMPLHLALRLAGQKSIVIHREVNAPNALLAQHSRIRRAIELRMARFAYKHADHIICLTRAMYKELKEDWRIPEEKLNLIPNGVIIPTSKIISKKITRPPYILYVGRLSAQKDIPTLLRAFAMLRERRECLLKIVGDGKERAKLEKMAFNLGIAPDVKFLGQVANPLPLYHEACVTVLSSTFEGFPNTLIESLAHGCPVVATDCPTGPAEIIDSDDVGYLAPIRNSEELAKQIERALTREFSVNKMLARAEFFSEEFLTLRVRELFGEIRRHLDASRNLSP